MATATTMWSPTQAAATDRPGWADTVKAAIRRAFRADMDVDQAAWQLSLWLTNPGLQVKLAKLHRQHSGSWPREDPAAAVLCILACCGLGAAWSVAVSPSPLSAASFATSIFWGAFVGKLSFLLVGVCTTSGVWWAVDKLLRIAPPPHATIEPAEWAYLFDVHCNASIAAVCGLSAHLVVLPVIAGGGVAGAVASNLLLGATVCAYWLVVMRGALALPFVGRGARALLYPAASAVLVLLVASLGGVDVWSLIAQLAAVQL